jgi:hypothetical protein
MNESLQLVRWGIPGTIFFGVVFFLSVVVRIGPADPPELFRFLNAHAYLEEHALIGTVAFLIGASVPVGFVIYQLYYWWFWFGWPKSRRDPARLFQPGTFDRLIDYYVEKYHLKILMDNEDDYMRTKLISEKGLKGVHRLHYQWVILSRVLREAKDKSVLVEFGRWDDIFHGLGASFTSVALASILFLSLWIIPSPFDSTLTGESHNLVRPITSYADSSVHSSANMTSDSLPKSSLSQQRQEDTLLASHPTNGSIVSTNHLSLAQWLQLLITTGLVVFVFGLTFRINRNAVIRQMTVTAKMILMEIGNSSWPEHLKNECFPAPQKVAPAPNSGNNDAPFVDSAR